MQNIKLDFELLQKKFDKLKKESKSNQLNDKKYLILKDDNVKQK